MYPFGNLAGAEKISLYGGKTKLMLKTSGALRCKAPGSKKLLNAKMRPFCLSILPLKTD